MEAQRAIADGKYPLDLYFLCLVLDAYSVPVPEDVASHVWHLSDR
ncbi:MAG TPA: hypothetical protein VFU71_09465 [Burkholderiaceae bacterium]|nr:hypothetical protein [Burkholderiaceae bacterium]